MAQRMVGRLPSSWGDAPVVPLTKVNALPAVLSCGELRGGLPVDLHRYRTVFPEKWSGLLKHHFNGDLRRVMFFFDVSERCARDWIAGRTGPNGPAAIIAASRIPGAVEFLMGQAA